MTVKIVVLKSGEDVIADVKEMMSKDDQVMGYFLTRPCVVKLNTTATITPEDETKPRFEKKSEYAVQMFPWMPLAKEKAIPLSTDWVVTMITPVDKVIDMYKEDVLKAYGKEDDQIDNPDKPVKTGLTD